MLKFMNAFARSGFSKLNRKYHIVDDDIPVTVQIKQRSQCSQCYQLLQNSKSPPLSGFVIVFIIKVEMFNPTLTENFSYNVMHCMFF